MGVYLVKKTGQIIATCLKYLINAICLYRYIQISNVKSNLLKIFSKLIEKQYCYKFVNLNENSYMTHLISEKTGRTAFNGASVL